MSSSMTDEELIKALRKMASWLRKEGAAEAATAATAASRLEALSRSGGAVREAVERDIATRLFAQDCMVLKNPFAVKDELGAAITDCFDIQPSAEDMAKFIASLRSILSEAALAAAPDPRKDYWQAVLAAASKWEDRALLSAAPPPPAPESAWRPIEPVPDEEVAAALRNVFRTDSPVAWVLPGDDTAKDGGWIDARITQWDEFSCPLYRGPPDVRFVAQHLAAAGLAVVRHSKPPTPPATSEPSTEDRDVR